MKDTKHSPGPWWWDFHINDDTDAFPELRAENGDCIMHFGGGECHDGDMMEGMYPQNELDLALIAAAPDLLQACYGILAWHDRNDPIHTSYFYLEKNIEKIRSAIAKAEGNVLPQIGTEQGG